MPARALRLASTDARAHSRRVREPSAPTAFAFARAESRRSTIAASFGSFEVATVKAFGDAAEEPIDDEALPGVETRGVESDECAELGRRARLTPCPREAEEAEAPPAALHAEPGGAARESGAPPVPTNADDAWFAGVGGRRGSWRAPGALAVAPLEYDKVEANVGHDGREPDARQAEGRRPPALAVRPAVLLVASDRLLPLAPPPSRACDAAPAAAAAEAPRAGLGV